MLRGTKASLTAQDAKRSTAISVHQVSMPKGGGAITGLGDSFQADEFTGTASLSIPLPASPCRGSEPELGLHYSSGEGNGVLGVGWQLSLDRISLKTSKGIPRYNGSDTYLLSGMDLVPTDGSRRLAELNGLHYQVLAFQPKIEAAFDAIEQWVAPTGESFWRILGPDNSVSLFGVDAASRIADPEAPTHVFAWLLAETQDVLGNRTIYEYKQEDADDVDLTTHEGGHVRTANRYLERISYGDPRLTSSGADPSWLFEIVFDYGEYDIRPEQPVSYRPARRWVARQDPFSTFDAGFEIRTHRLLRNILMFHRFSELGADPVLVHATCLAYQENPTLTRLASVQSVGYRRRTQGCYDTRALPPLLLEYTRFEPGGRTFQPLTGADGQQLPSLDEAPQTALVDLFGEGRPGLLYADQTAVLYREPIDGAVSADGSAPAQFGAPIPVATFPIDRQVHTGAAYRATESTSQPTYNLMDLTGEGYLDLVVSSRAATGFYAARNDRTWQPLQPLPAMPTEFDDPESLLVDVAGTGLHDLLRLEGDSISVYPGQGRDGFAPVERMPWPADLPLPRKGDQTELVTFADLFGTGRQHLTRIRDGVIECWPNLGHGRFGKRIVLDNPPRFGADFDAARLFLADLDGSGTTDLIYARADRVDIYFNYSGNSFSDPLSLPLPVLFGTLSQIFFADVYGSGSSCLVLSEGGVEPRHFCIDLCQGQKPYLLRRVDGGLGSTTEIEYRSSTAYYFADKRAGVPWVGGLPFPVQVVSRVKMRDYVSQTELVSEYSYHHGFFDRVEREFRGFGRVERRDAETLDAVRKSAQNTPYQVPPVLIRSWYHTGVWQAQTSVSQPFNQEYFRGDRSAWSLPDSVVDWGSLGEGTPPDDETQRELRQALAGSLLRQEVYALDGTERQDLPYKITEQNYRIVRLQSKGANRYGVYFPHGRENVHWDYERDITDPRVSHGVTLTVDPYGNVLEGVDVAYGRRPSATGTVPEQLQPLIKLSRNRYVNRTETDTRLLGVPIEHRSYEVQNAPAPIDGHYSPADLVGALAARSEGAGLRLLGWDRYLYWSTEQGAGLPLGEVDPRALLHRAQTAVAGEADLRSAFAGALTDGELADLLAGDGGYLRDGGYVWNPGLVQYYLGADRFFLPERTVDPFGAATRYGYERYGLALCETIDALNNRLVVEVFDYQALQPLRVRDANGNLGEVLLDALGFVVATSRYGHENGAAIGFAPLAEYATLAAADAAEFVASPDRFLQRAGSAFYYDLDSYRARGVPVHAAQLLAEHYPGRSPTAGSQAAIHFFDGFGRTVQSKQRSAPGLAFVVGGDGQVREQNSPDRWLTSGRTVYDNKGNPVKTFEPCYTEGSAYIDHPELNRFGSSDTLFYDPLGRNVRVETAKGFVRRVEFTAWTEQYFDENDTILESPYYQLAMAPGSTVSEREREALRRSEPHNDTPSEHVLDNLGRMVRARELLAGAADDSGTVSRRTLETHRELDIEGHELASSDPRLGPAGMQNFRTTYDLQGAPLRVESADADTRWQLHNTLGRTIFARDGRGTVVTTRYDVLARPVAVHVCNGAVGLNQIVERTVYGDGVDDQGLPQVLDPERNNLRGRVHAVWDSAGMAGVEGYDLLGNPLATRRRLRRSDESEASWPGNDPAAWDPVLEPTEYRASTSRDAMGRVIASIDPDGNQVRPVYLPTSQLGELHVTAHGDAAEQAYVRAIEYNARGQRTQVAYGNGVNTTYTYEATTFNLQHILSQRPDGTTIQDLRYTEDPVGNIIFLEDAVLGTVFHDQQRIDPLLGYSYDSLYRLKTASGCEHIAASLRSERSGDFDPSIFLPISQAHPNDITSIRNYLRRYCYDDGGNLLSERHIAAGNGASFTRKLTVSPRTNRAVPTDLTEDPAAVDAFFDANGNQLAVPGLAGLSWDWRNQLASATLVERQDAPSDREFYVYDGGGQRVRKVTVRYGYAGTSVRYDETIYLGSLEIRRIRIGDHVIEERHSLRINDGEHLVAIRDEFPVVADDDDPTPRLRYQLTDHLGSTAMEVDDRGLLISHEVFYPYGGTALVRGRSVSEVKQKLYRYSAKERDAATGFYYYGARYYAPWIGRWLSPDPAGTIDGLNLYAFVRSCPISYLDSRGLGTKKTTRRKQPLRRAKNNFKSYYKEHGSGFKVSKHPDVEYPRGPLELAANLSSLAKKLVERRKRGNMPKSLTLEMIAHNANRKLEYLTTLDKKMQSYLTPAEKYLLKIKHWRKIDMSKINLKKENIARCHKLADSSIYALMVTADHIFRSHGGPTNSQKVNIEKFFKSLTGDDGAKASILFTKLEETSKLTQNDVREIAHSLNAITEELSMNPNNLRFGDSTINTMILYGFDPNANKMGIMSPESTSIKKATIGAGLSLGVAATDIANSATTPSINKKTQRSMSSSMS